MRRGQIIASFVAGLVIAGAPVSAEEARISGIVASVDSQSGRLVVEELTAAAGPEPAAARRQVVLGPQTNLELVRRAGDGVGGWPQGYAAAPLSRAELKAGDFVTVTGERHGEGVMAGSLVVVRPDGTP